MTKQGIIVMEDKNLVSSEVSAMRKALLLIIISLLAAGLSVQAICEESSDTAAAGTETEGTQVALATVGKPTIPGSSQSAVPSLPDKPYTSVIIDATGLKLDRCMSPKIRRTDGSEVWGTVSVDYDYVEDHGIVAYAKNMEEAKKNQRAGANPMIIKATGLSGGNFRSDPVISNADADLLLKEDAKGKFLGKFNVIFVKDGKL